MDFDPRADDSLNVSASLHARTMRFFVRAHAFFLFAAIVLSTLLFATRAGADEGNAARVEDLKKRGNQAMVDLNYAEALDAYTAAIALAPEDASLYYNLGRAQQAREDYPAALDALDAFQQKAAPEMRARVPKLAQLVEDVRSRVGTLSIACTANVGDGTLSVGDKKTLKGCTTTPVTVRISVPARQAVVVVKFAAESYQAQSARVTVEGGGPVVNVRLTVLANGAAGLLLVHASPPHALISVDGTARGNPPLELPLPAGAHSVDLRAEGHEARHLSVVIEAGRTKELPITLDRSTPITSQWWFWTGVGVVAVGIGVTIWYLVAQPESSPSKGSIDPGQVSAPLMRF